MSFLQNIWTDLREKRLWPIAVALIAAIVAVPVVLAKSAAQQPAPRPAPVNTNPAQVAGLPVISVDNGTGSPSLKGVKNRDPFTQQKAPTTTAASSPTTTVGSPTGTSGTPGTSGTTGSTGSSGSSGGTVSVTPTPGTTTSPTTTTPGLSPTPSFAGLTETEAYHVTLAVSDPNGGFSTIDPLPRLSLIPSAKQPLVIEFGVLKGGDRVLFLLQPGTVVSGPGTCTPGPVDCQILSVPTNKTEQLGTRNAAGVVTPVTSFTVTAITKDEYKTTDAANKARQAVVAAGQSLLDRTSLSALSMFQYQPSVGAVVDLRNLTVGGS